LHLSEDEKATIISIFNLFEDELNNRIDDFSQDIMISHIELLLNYANRMKPPLTWGCRPFNTSPGN